MGFLTVFIVPCVVAWQPSLRRISFTEAEGPIELTSGGRVASHKGPNSSLGSFRLNQVYSEGVHTVKIFVEKLTLSPSSDAFIGVVHRAEQSSSVSTSHGWFIANHKPAENGSIVFSIVQKLIR